jgi:regulator of sigma E protease
MTGSTALSWLTMIASFIVAIGILVSVHEFGHFWVARKLGIRVLRFAVGFGKPLWSRVSKRDGVEYVIGSIPLGGYVKMLDEREGDVKPEDAPFSYNRAPPWKRILTLLAGPVANLIFAILAYWVLLMIGIPSLKPVVGDVAADSIAARAGLHRDDLIVAVQGQKQATREGASMALFENVVEPQLQLRVRSGQGQGDERDLTLNLGDNRRVLTEPETMMQGLGFEFWTPHLPPIINAVSEGGAAARAGLRANDELITIADQPVNDVNEVAKLISPQMGRTINVTVKRDGKQLMLPVTVIQETVDGRNVGRIGVQLQSSYVVPDSMRALQKYGPLAALARGAEQTWETAALSLKMMWKMLAGQVSTKNLSGPISIAEYTGVAARQGGMAFLNWLALISISIGIFNLLPIPMLDGGQILYQLVELLKGSPVSERIQLISQQIGVAMLLMLLSLTLYNDIARHLS